MSKILLSRELVRRLYDSAYRADINELHALVVETIVHHPDFRRLDKREYGDVSEKVMEAIYLIAERPDYHDKKGRLLKDEVLKIAIISFLTILNDGALDNANEIPR